MKIMVIFGGTSTEHDVSIVSGTSVIQNLDKQKYNIMPVYIDKQGKWYKYTKEIEKIKAMQIGEKPKELKAIENIVQEIKKQDVIFPVLHGKAGEDGSIQGMFEMFSKPYVGCKILASSVAMDKIYTKTIIEKAGIKQAKSVYIKKNKEQYTYVDERLNEQKCTEEEILKKIESKIKYPMFVKPSNSGSSVGVNKAKNKKELKKAIEDANEFDPKILIEQEIKGKEIECAVLGNEEIISSEVGEIKSAEEFYNFNSKYKNEKSQTIIPAQIPKEKQEEIKKLAIKAFKAIDGKGLSRIDFFLEEKTNQIYLNEINTLPGFTQISMYPKLFEAKGIKYSKLLDKLIEIAIKE